MSEESTAIAGATEPVSNVSVEEYIARRSGIASQQDEPAEESEEDTEVELEEQEAEPEDDTEYADMTLRSATLAIRVSELASPLTEKIDATMSLNVVSFGAEAAMLAAGVR